MAEIGLIVVVSADNSDLDNSIDSRLIENTPDSNFLEALRTGSKSLAGLANISQTHYEIGRSSFFSTFTTSLNVIVNVTTESLAQSDHYKRIQVAEV